MNVLKRGAKLEKKVMRTLFLLIFAVKICFGYDRYCGIKEEVFPRRIFVKETSTFVAGRNASS
jgi:hypothetical protein